MEIQLAEFILDLTTVELSEILKTLSMQEKDAYDLLKELVEDKI